LSPLIPHYFGHLGKVTPSRKVAGVALSSMIVSGDWQEVSVFECILTSLQINVEVEPEPRRAWDKLVNSKVDAVVLDCDLNGSQDLLNKLRHSGQNTSPVVIFSASRGGHKPEPSDDTFVVQKPVSVEQAVHTLSAARNLILNGRLRYHRQTIHAPVSLTGSSGEHLSAQLLNVSQGGVLLRLSEPRELRGTFELGFTLPGNKLSVEAQASVIWSDAYGNAGLHFAEVNESVRRDLQLWLERQYFQA
jgi:PilZ domain